jgi:SAM-dependent methyltransferase
VICRDCGLFYVNPIPSQAALEGVVSGSDLYTQDQLNKRVFFRRRAVQLFERLEQLVPPATVLDVGCAIGTELVVARERGWQGVGIELSSKSIAIARSEKLEVIDRTLERSNLPSEHFQVVTANHVLEHIAYPAQFMAEIKRVLSRAGYLFVAVPNVNHWQRYYYQQRYRWTFQDDHFVHFSMATLRRFLEGHGFRIIELYSSRCFDFHDDLADRSLPFRLLNRWVENLGLGIEIFCLAQLTT